MLINVTWCQKERHRYAWWHFFPLRESTTAYNVTFEQVIELVSLDIISTVKKREKGIISNRFIFGFIVNYVAVVLEERKIYDPQQMIYNNHIKLKSPEINFMTVIFCLYLLKCFAYTLPMNECKRVEVAQCSHSKWEIMTWYYVVENDSILPQTNKSQGE